MNPGSFDLPEDFVVLEAIGCCVYVELVNNVKERKNEDEGLYKGRQCGNVNSCIHALASLNNGPLRQKRWEDEVQKEYRKS